MQNKLLSDKKQYLDTVRSVIVNEHKQLQESTINQALNFLQAVFTSESIRQTTPVKIIQDNKTSYNNNIISLTKKTSEAGSLIHEFTHHLAMQNLPCLKKYNDIFLAKTLQLYYTQMSGLSVDLYAEDDQARGLRRGELFAEQYTHNYEQPLLEKINQYLGETTAASNLYDDYEVGAFVFGVLRELHSNGQSKEEIIKLIQSISAYDFPLFKDFP